MLCFCVMGLIDFKSEQLRYYMNLIFINYILVILVLLFFEFTLSIKFYLSLSCPT